MKTCKTCKWHKQDPNNRPGMDEGPEMDRGALCTSTKIHENDSYHSSDEQYGKDHLVYPFDEGGVFWTGNDFGCVHHAVEDVE